MKKKIILEIVLVGMLSAMSFVLEKFGIEIPLFATAKTYKITFYGIPLMIAGVVYGWKVGLLSGLIMGFLSQVVFSQYGVSLSTPLWMIAPIMWGVIPALVMLIFKKKFNIYSISTVVIITSIFASLTNSLAIYLDGVIFGYSTEITFVLILLRLCLSVLVAVIYIPVLYFTSKRLYYNVLNNE